MNELVFLFDFFVCINGLIARKAGPGRSLPCYHAGAESLGRSTGVLAVIPCSARHRGERSGGGILVPIIPRATGPAQLIEVLNGVEGRPSAPNRR